MAAPIDLDPLYRAHAPAIVASLTKSFGPSRLDVIESGVQEAFIAALAWAEPPANPAGWLHTVARRRVIDALRKAASSGDVMSPYHLEAAIAACHALATIACSTSSHHR